MFQEFAYAACNLITTVIILVKLTLFSLQREAFLNLIRFCYENFWKRDYDGFGRTVVERCDLRCTYFVCTFTFFAQSTAFIYTIQPIIRKRLYFYCYYEKVFMGRDWSLKWWRLWKFKAPKVISRSIILRLIISTTVHIDDDEKHGIMIVTKKNDAKFNFLIVQVSEVVYELHINSGNLRLQY